jgi:hypothetical protein
MFSDSKLEITFFYDLETCDPIANHNTTSPVRFSLSLAPQRTETRPCQPKATPKKELTNSQTPFHCSSEIAKKYCDRLTQVEDSTARARRREHGYTCHTQDGTRGNRHTSKHTIRTAAPNPARAKARRLREHSSEPESRSSQAKMPREWDVFKTQADSLANENEHRCAGRSEPPFDDGYARDDLRAREINMKDK